MDKLPIYQITIDPTYADNGEDLGIDMIAFTSNPAIKVKGMAFTSNDKPMMFKDDVKMRIAAPAMIPMHIYRRDDEDGKEYYVQFTEEVIEQLHVKFMHNLNNTNLFNVEHDENLKAPAYILEAWIVDDPKTDKSLHTYNTEVPKGSLFVVAQVTNRKYYDALVEQGRIGFSIEGFLGMKLNEQFNNKQMDKPTYELDGKFYEVIDGKLSEVVKLEEEVKEEEMAEEIQEEELAEEPKEEEMSDEPKAEEELMEEPAEEVKEEELAVDPEADAEAIIGIVTPLLDAFREEIIDMLAQMKEEAQPKEVVEEEMSQTKLSAHERFSATAKFLTEN